MHRILQLYIFFLDGELQERRFFPWLVVSLGCGILVYSYYPIPLFFICGLSLFSLSGIILVFRFRQSIILATLFWVLAFLSLGFFCTYLRICIVKQPTLDKPYIGDVEAIIEVIDFKDKDAQLTLAPLKMSGLKPDQYPALIKARVRIQGALLTGSKIILKLRLYPPPKASVPNGYNFSRDYYFKKIGAVGRGLGTYKVDRTDHPSTWIKNSFYMMEQWRNQLTSRIVTLIGGQSGAVSAALITGKRGHISQETDEILRAAGIYHVVSISGLHMVLAAGVFFWVTRALLALSYSCTLYWPIKKISACIAMIGATCYCIFAGAEVATIRSLIMVLIAFGAVLADRPVLSVRNVSSAAFIILILWPESLLGPSFQMSFSAVLALIAFAEFVSIRDKNRRPFSRIPLFRLIEKLYRIVYLTFGTAFIAGLATAPFSAYHFQALQSYGLIGNALTLPFMSFIVMPCALIGTLLYPIGWDQVIWIIMGWGTEIVLLISRWISNWPQAVVSFPQISHYSLILLSCSILLATLPTFKVRKLSVVPFSIGLLLCFFPQRFHIAIDREGRGAVIRGENGVLMLVGNVSSFQLEQWLRADGDLRFLSLKQNNSLQKKSQIMKSFSSSKHISCDSVGCLGKDKEGLLISVVKHPSAFARDCSKADIIVSRFYAPQYCKASFIIDKQFLQFHGATYFIKEHNNETYHLKTVQ